MGNNSLAAVYSKAFFQQVDRWKTQLIPKNQNKTNFHSIQLEGEHEKARQALKKKER